ncbi:hypothetical protein LX15_000314 [Streptoalloteichus tenebrarius]|uniref:Uncharacterized protein n=1 Tax=Streptoalloteichus tenebrarius (strain ATCC 17920 / DSM 40477 / JCM 4838 / CBS 697.72 / NBRC 16177 / NCIMB 11028 / NRRL B-12390 / A12253. 1 / ISP 5477) TaxID=1933 RepID=A0ABT1HM85_STRSD|nr:hypothetical protein [Streptoalloteichus tenebrarius]MCP2256631.1 hypothetical protein [Streptoalloteichus tenebrarius]BFF04984.1 hypothetical protein GCM10020241_66590 [Streptoalloteichus tenebrarius]
MDGFEVGRDGLRAVGGRLLLVADDLRSVRGTWDTATVNGGVAFGTADCGSAYDDLQQHLFHLLDRRLRHWALLASSAVDSAAEYDLAEDAGRREFDRERP